MNFNISRYLNLNQWISYPLPRSKGFTRLTTAIAKNELTTIQAMAAEGFSDWVLQDNLGRTPLALAVELGNEDVIKELLTHYSEEQVNIPNKNGFTPLMIASSQDFQFIVPILLEARADPLIKNKQGETALDIARRLKRINVIPILQQHFILFNC